MKVLSHLYTQTCQGLVLLNEDSAPRKELSGMRYLAEIYGQKSQDRTYHKIDASMFLPCLVIYLTLIRTGNDDSAVSHIHNHKGIRDCVTRAQEHRCFSSVFFWLIHAQKEACMCFIASLVPSIAFLWTLDKHCRYTTSRRSICYWGKASRACKRVCVCDLGSR